MDAFNAYELFNVGSVFEYYGRNAHYVKRSREFRKFVYVDFQYFYFSEIFVFENLQIRR